MVVTRWLVPAIPACKLDDQFGFRTTGSTTCALICLLHHVTAMLERCSYVRCLLIDFSKAFDVIDHPILLAKLVDLGIPDCASVCVCQCDCVCQLDNLVLKWTYSGG